MNIPANRRYREEQNALGRMWRDQGVLGIGEEFKHTNKDRAIFLLGPTPIGIFTPYGWLVEAVSLLRSFGFDEHIFVPAYRDRKSKALPKDRAAEWIQDTLLWSKSVVCWLPDQSNQVGIPTYYLGKIIGKIEVGGRRNLFVGWPSLVTNMEGVERDLNRLQIPIHLDLPKLCEVVTTETV